MLHWPPVTDPAALEHDVVEAVPDGIVVVDEHGTIRLVNQQTERMFGWARSDLLGQPVEVLMDPALAPRHRDHREHWNRNPRVRPMSVGLRLAARRRDGSEFPVEISLSPMRDAAGLHTIASVRDITERVRLDEELQAARDSVATLEERERIARDLHDTVIQHLFAVGMSLQAVESQITDLVVHDRVRWAVDHLDETIREVRSVIFGLQTARGPGGLRTRVAGVVAESARGLGFEPRLRFDGLVDAGVAPDVGEHVLATVREALSNVARHARASRVDLSIVVHGERLTLRVVDDGVGIRADARRGHGLANLAARAEALGGSCRIEPGPASGTVVEWTVPVGP